MTNADGQSLPGLRYDLIEYLIIAMPDLASLSDVGAPLADLVNTGLLRVLDLVVLAKNVYGAIDVLEAESLSYLSALRPTGSEIDGLLSEHDLELASMAIRAGCTGMVLVVEGRWARSLAEAAAHAGGQIVAGERIPAARVDAALADLRDQAL